MGFLKLEDDGYLLLEDGGKLILDIDFIPYNSISYLILVKDKNNQYIGQFNIYKDLKFGKKLNNYGECSFSIPVSSPNLTNLISLRNYEVEIYKYKKLNKETSVEFSLIWAGEQASLVTDLTENGDDWATLTCYTYLEMLNHRFTVAERIFAIEDNVDSGDIAWTLIDESQKQIYDATNTENINYGTYTFEWIYPKLFWYYNTTHFATTVTSSEGITNNIKFTNFGLSIPTGATISGIELSYNNWGDCAWKKDTYVYLIIGGVVQAINIGKNEIINDGIITYGGKDDLLGYTLTPDILNSSNFGFSLAFTISDEFISIDNVRKPQIKVYYCYKGEGINPDLGITEGVIEPTIVRELKLYNANIMNTIIDLSNMTYGFDFEITDDKKLNVWIQKGSDRTDEIQLIFGVNISSATITQDFVNPCNSSIVLGQSYDGNDMLRVETNDATSQTAIKLRESVENQSDVSDLESLQYLGQTVVDKYKNEVLNIEVNLVNNSNISITDFEIGDTIRVIIKKGIYDLDLEMRIHEWNLEWKENKTESLSLLLSIL